MSHGYSPILNFELGINEDLDKLVEKACDTKNTSYVCRLEGEILKDEYVKVAMLKLSENSGYGGPTISLT